ncbi:nitroreductase [Peterkaempfera sp. SMS 1(5)a]|uniref:nitroreductase n=1 Tax=Peterkaempfera podocarpi TaxID=3232308 RepID=UPI00366D5BD4
MNVREAVLGRRSVRGFLNRPVGREVIERVLDTARRAPSGGNLQPWRLYALAGEPLARLKQAMSDLARVPALEQPPMGPSYPRGLHSPYRERRFENGEQLYAALGIPREDKPARLRQFARNYQLFDAPVGLFCYIDRRMNPAQYADLGSYLQTVMLLLHEEGLASCAQGAWSRYPHVVAEVLKPLEELALFCGMAVGYEDPGEPANALRTVRAPLAEVVDFVGWGEQPETDGEVTRQPEE